MGKSSKYIFCRLDTMSKRHSIQISEKVYEKLKVKGHFGESFDAVIERILDERRGKPEK